MRRGKLQTIAKYVAQKIAYAIASVIDVQRVKPMTMAETIQ